MSQPTPSAPPLRATTRADRAWILDAACQTADPRLFDPRNRYEARAAVTVCLTCPVRRACLREALDDEAHTSYGPWLVRGGKTPKERRELRDGTSDARLAALVDAAPLPAARALAASLKPTG